MSPGVLGACPWCPDAHPISAVARVFKARRGRRWVVSRARCVKRDKTLFLMTPEVKPSHDR